MKFLNMARLTALSLVVGACAGASIVTNVYYEKGGLRDTFFFVASDREFLIEIHGHPNGTPQAEFDASVIAAMQGTSFGRLTTFTTTPSALTHQSYRLVMVVVGDRYGGASSICRGGNSAPQNPAAGRVNIRAAFCFRDDPQSRLNVSYAPGSTALRDAMSQVFITLFPRADITTFDPRRFDDEVFIFPP